MSYAYINPPRKGQPWIETDDAKLLDDYELGVSLHLMALRQLRSEDECERRLMELGRSLKEQPPAKKFRHVDWTRR
jgi:hypothetical protein